MICPKCKENVHGRIVGEHEMLGSGQCLSCKQWSSEYEWKRFEVDVVKEEKKTYRPKHYEKGHDTFAWAEHKFDLETNLNICRFNIHKYNDRDKGQDKGDFEKIIDYAQRALYLIQEDTMEVQGL